MSRPSIVLKLATSLDGKIALANGKSQWITGKESRAEVHRLRAASDLLVTASGTVRADNPHMTARPAGFEGQQPDCAVFDRTLALSLQARLFDADRRVIAVTLDGADTARAEALKARGVEIVIAPAGAGGHPDLASGLDALAGRGYQRIFIEGGAGLAASALASGRVTRIDWFRAPIVIGGDGLGVFAPLGLETLGAAPRFVRTHAAPCGEDLHEVYEAR